MKRQWLKRAVSETTLFDQSREELDRRVVTLEEAVSALLDGGHPEPAGELQLTAYWRLRGLVKYLCGRGEWGRMTRTGFSVAEPTPEEREAAAAP